MYEPSEREIGIELLKKVDRVEQKLNWILGGAIGVLLVYLFRA